MLGIVLVGVVRVGGVRSVGRDHDRALELLEEAAAVGTRAGGDSFQDRGDQATGGSIGRRRTDFFVIEHHEQRDSTGAECSGVDVGGHAEQALDGGETRELVVDPGGGQQFGVASDECRRLGVEGHHLRRQDLVR